MSRSQGSISSAAPPPGRPNRETMRNYSHRVTLLNPFLHYMGHSLILTPLSWSKCGRVESWNDCLAGGPKLMSSSRDKLIQVKFLHGVYYTPVRLHKMYPTCDPQCPQCSGSSRVLLAHVLGLPKYCEILVGSI